MLCNETLQGMCSYARGIKAVLIKSYDRKSVRSTLLLLQGGFLERIPNMEQETGSDTYLTLLIESLKKKCEVLDHLYQLTKEQETLFEEENINEERFNQIIDAKDKEIQILQNLDEGFEQIYQRVREELSAHTVKYQNEVMMLKSLITIVTDKNVQLLALEKRNKSKIETYFRLKHKEIMDFKKSNHLVSNYYKDASNNHQQSYFFDKKN